MTHFMSFTSTCTHICIIVKVFNLELTATFEKKKIKEKTHHCRNEAEISTGEVGISISGAKTVLKYYYEIMAFSKNIWHLKQYMKLELWLAI